MTKAERTRQLIIEKTAPLFNKKGFDGTSLSDLTESTGLTKGALYGNFNDKEEIALEAFKYSIKKVKETARQKVDAEQTYKKQLFALIDFYAEYVFNPPIPGGCPMLNMAVEADDYRTPMRKVVTKELMDTITFITSLLEGGIKAGEFKKDTKSNEIAYTIFCSVEGALMFARVERSDEPMKIIVRHCKNLVNQISK
ncbi:TetR/AcrR family transcriptional regulator [Ohtaekwangia koreensis]|uniref:Transcriptional regulator, TetR family n=1 Tax=Ohtaekwangia koreensis TaxID=688867 RepID=A0A1T5MG00_9BACT|nr:TetR/AcrR family transcriptional regulator [Ohtaekwangia koreensis]SKC86799.1 transcriptional regulator, TetR family [Ohtaekwangia koreensis]